MKYYPSLLWTGVRWVSTDIYYYDWINHQSIMSPIFNMGDIVSYCETDLKWIITKIFINAKTVNHIDEVYSAAHIKYEITSAGNYLIARENQLFLIGGL